MPIDPGTASIVSAGVQAVGGLLGGNKQKAPSYFPYYKAMLGKDVAKNTTGAKMNAMIESEMLAGKMADAAKYGISKLAMLGVPGLSPSAPMAVGGEQNGSFDFQGVGQSLERAAHAYSTEDERRQAEILGNLRIEREQAEIDLLRSQSRAISAPGSPPARGQMPGLDGQPNVIPRSIWLRDRDGRLTEVLNPDAGDSEGLQIQDWLTRSLPQDVKNSASRSWDNLKSLFGKRPKKSFNPYRM